MSEKDLGLTVQNSVRKIMLNAMLFADSAWNISHSIVKDFSIIVGSSIQ